jgi:hypothetical protein
MVSPVPDPPSASILPPLPDLRARLASALREVSLVRRLIRAAEAVRPHPLMTADRIAPPVVAKGADHV